MKQTNTSYLLLLSMVSAMGGLLFGYDWVVIGGAKIFYEPFFALEGLSAMRGWAMSSALVGCLAGAILAGRGSDKYGRKKMLILASVLFAISAYGTGAVDDFSWFIAYRILGGLGIGIASNVSPIYIAEISPAAVRGRFVSLNQLTIVIGILAAQTVNMKIGSSYTINETITFEGIEMAWRWMFWAELVPAMLFFGLSFVIPESPRWLAVNGKEKQAFKIFAHIEGEEYAQQSINEIKSVSSLQEPGVSWRSLLAPSVRRVLVIGVVLAVFQQWCGINVIFNYAHEIFSAAGYNVSDVLMNIVITGITNLIFTFVAIYTVDKIGRRALMLIGSIGLAVIYMTMGVFYLLGISGMPMLILVVLAIACYAMSLAPIVWVVLSEIFPVKIRGAAMALSTSFLWIACFLLTYTFPILNASLGTIFTFWVYGIICIAGVVFVYKYLPETKGKSLEQIEKELKLR